VGWGRTARQGNEINTARRLLKIGFAPADLLYSESLTKSTTSTGLHKALCQSKDFAVLTEPVTRSFKQPTPCFGLLQKSTCLSEAFSDQIKAPKAPKTKNNTGFYGK
jgi:hypothetical protein